MARIVKSASERRGEILDATERLIIVKGFAALTMEDIMHEVGIAKGTLYHHFHSKEEILDGIILRTVQAIQERVTAVVNMDIPATSKILAVMSAAQVEGQSGEVAEHFNTTSDAGFHLRSLVQAVNRIAPLIAQIIEQGCASGEFDCPDPLGVAEIMLAAGGMLTDTGIFGDMDHIEVSRRTASLLQATERLLGCSEGALTAALNSGENAQ